MTHSHSHPSTSGALAASSDAVAAEWDERFGSSEQLFSGRPNGALVAEVIALPPGRALDVGCGEGADAIWLAENGWTVTALDVSQVALDRAAHSAQHAGVEVEWMHAALVDAHLTDRFDLVTVHYPALPSSPDRTSERALVDAVAPGGLLLVVHHAGFDGDAARAHGFDPDDYVGTTDMVAALLGEPWHIEIDTHRPRDTPAGTDTHRHTHDVVLRARRSLASADHHHHHDQHQHGDQQHQHGRDDGLRDMLELDAEVLHDYWESALAWVAQSVRSAPTRIVDLGAGVGTGAIGLSRHFPDADVIAVDIDADSLTRLRAKASTAGLGPRIRTLEADFDAAWPEMGSVDLTWASMSMHHLADPDRVLRDALAATRPGGLFAIAEFAEFVRFLPADLGIGRPGLEDRIMVALKSENADAAPELGSAWAQRLSDAGWRVTEERDFHIALDPPRHPRAGEWAHGWFQRLAGRVADRLDDDDRATLALLLDPTSPHALLGRTDLFIRGIRTVTIGTRAQA